MSNTITVPLRDVAGQIRDSIRAVLRSHAFVVCEYPEGTNDGFRYIGAERFEQLLVELGNNAAMALVAVAYDHAAAEAERSAPIAESAAAARRTEEIARWLEDSAASAGITADGTELAAAIRRGDFKHQHGEAGRP